MISLKDYILENSQSNKTIVLCMCGSDKDPKSKQEPVRADEIYTGEFAESSLAYARKQYGNKENTTIYILSAKYGLLPLHKKIKYYDAYLGDFSAGQKEKWRDMVVDQLKQAHYNLETDKFVFITGSSYYEPFEGIIKHMKTPMKNCTGMGYMLQWLKDRI